MNLIDEIRLEVEAAFEALKAMIPAPVLAPTNGVVKTVTPGGSVDNVAQVTVTVYGSDTFAPYLDSYLSPAVGDVVRVQFDQGSPIIIGRVVGFPTF